MMMKSQLIFTGFLASAFVGLACGGTSPEVVDKTSSSLIEVVRVSQSSDGKPIIARSTVTRATIDKMVTQRREATIVSGHKPPPDVLSTPRLVRPPSSDRIPTPGTGTLNPSENTAQVSSAYTQCSVDGQPAGSSCPPPCSEDDLWVYDQTDTIGHKMLCLNIPDAQTHYWLPSIPYDTIDPIGWNWFAVSAWGANQPATMHCDLGSTEVRTALVDTFTIVDDIGCVWPNAQNDNGNVAWVTFP